MEERRYRYVLLEQDGVISLRSAYGYDKCWEKFEFLPRALPALRLLATHDYAAVVISRRNSVGAGLQSPRDLEAIARRLQLEVAISHGHIAQVYYCQHRIEDGCDCYGPNSGLIARAKAEHGFLMEETYFVGDKDFAIEAGLAAGCSCIRIQRDAFLHPPALAEGRYRVMSNLFEAAEYIVETGKTREFAYAGAACTAAKGM
jgi:D-glycero-D-manno-heptose 1,7-bisphosphate phosphatase